MFAPVPGRRSVSLLDLTPHRQACPHGTGEFVRSDVNNLGSFSRFAVLALLSASLLHLKKDVEKKLRDRDILCRAATCARSLVNWTTQTRVRKLKDARKRQKILCYYVHKRLDNSNQKVHAKSKNNVINKNILYKHTHILANLIWSDFLNLCLKLIFT